MVADVAWRNRSSMVETVRDDRVRISLAGQNLPRLRVSVFSSMSKLGKSENLEKSVRNKEAVWKQFSKALAHTIPLSSDFFGSRVEAPMHGGPRTCPQKERKHVTPQLPAQAGIEDEWLRRRL